MDFSAILLDNSWIVICSGILTSRKTFLNSFFSPSMLVFFSFNLALLTEARLLCLISISSTFNALETVNLKSLLSIGPLSFSLLFPVGLSSFLIKALVACCSTNFLTKFFFLGSVLFVALKFWFSLLLFLLPLKGSFFFTAKDFLPEVEIELVSIFFFKSDEIVSVFFCLYP